MMNARRVRPAADVAVGYAADDGGSGVAYAAIHTGSATSIVRFPFRVAARAGLDGLDLGYAAVALVGAHLKLRGFSRVRIRVADARLATDLGGSGSPPKALGMAYVRIRCSLNGLGSVRLAADDSNELADLTARAQAEVQLHVAA